MDYKVIYSPNAISDLAEVVGFVAQDDPQAALRLGKQLAFRQRKSWKYCDFGMGRRKTRVCKVQKITTPGKRELFKSKCFEK
jgi:hypothetical protein